MMLNKLKEKSIATAKKMKEDGLSKDALNNIKTTVNKALGKGKLKIFEPNLSKDKNQGLREAKPKQALIKKVPKAITPINQKQAIITTQNAIERLLNVNLPDWIGLKKQSEITILEAMPAGIVKWMDSELPIAKRHIKKGKGYDLWNDKNQFILKAKPSMIEKIIYAILSLFSALLTPWYALRNTIERILEKIAEKLGPFFAILALPTAFLAFLGDIISMTAELVLSIPRLLFSPLVLIRSILLFIPTLLTKLIARILWAFLLPIIGKILNSVKLGNAEPMHKLMMKYKWIRYVLLGFFRKERPTGAIILIPVKTVSQVFRVKRNGIFNRGEYLIVVEGEKLVSGLMERFKSWFFSLVLPFYWERTVHMIHLPKEPVAKNKIIDVVSSGTNQSIDDWK